MAAKIKKGDQVIVIAGKDTGKQGDVLEIITAENRAIVSGVNIAKRHTKTWYDAWLTQARKEGRHLL